MICVCFLVNRSKFSTENEGKHEQMSPVISGSEESLAHRSVACLWGSEESWEAWTGHCISWEPALLWHSGFCREQHSCGHTCSCHRELNIAKLKELFLVAQRLCANISGAMAQGFFWVAGLPPWMSLAASGEGWHSQCWPGWGMCLHTQVWVSGDGQK